MGSLQMREFGCIVQPSLRRVVRAEVCVCGMGVTRSVVVVTRNLSGTAVVHTSGWGMRKMTKVEHWARSWHWIERSSPRRKLGYFVNWHSQSSRSPACCGGRTLLLGIFSVAVCSRPVAPCRLPSRTYSVAVWRMTEEMAHRSLGCLRLEADQNIQCDSSHLTTGFCPESVLRESALCL